MRLTWRGASRRRRQAARPPRGRVCLPIWTAQASCFSAGLLPTESWAPCGRLYAYADLIDPGPQAASEGLSPNELNATYGAPEPTHGSPAIMVRMSVRYCVEISSRGDGVRPDLQYSLLLQKAAKGGRGAPRLCYTPSPHHSCTADRRTDHGWRWRELPTLSPAADGPRPGRAEGGCGRSARGRGPAELEGGCHRSARGRGPAELEEGSR